MLINNEVNLVRHETGFIYLTTVCVWIWTEQYHDTHTQLSGASDTVTDERTKQTWPWWQTQRLVCLRSAWLVDLPCTHYTSHITCQCLPSTGVVGWTHTGSAHRAAGTSQVVKNSAQQMGKWMDIWPTQTQRAVWRWYCVQTTTCQN